MSVRFSSLPSDRAVANKELTQQPYAGGLEKMVACHDAPGAYVFWSEDRALVIAWSKAFAQFVRPLTVLAGETLSKVQFTCTEEEAMERLIAGNDELQTRLKLSTTPDGLVPCDRAGCINGEYIWGGILDGRPMYSGTCFRCNGTCKMPARKARKA